MTPKQMLFRTVELPVPGTLYLHSMPGRFEPFARAAQAIAEYGIARVVCLTPMDEILDKSPEYHRAIATGLPWIHEFCPIRDYGVPGEVQNFSDLARKVADGLRLGADEVCISTDPAQMAARASQFDFILNTVAAPHDLDPFLNLLRRDGTMTLVGAPEHPHPSPQVFSLIFKRRSLAGSLIGGIRETQEMLDFCAQHGIVSDIETIRMQDINAAYERMLRSDVKYRFVIDLASLED